jgi:type I restriction enzyme S subunit
MRFESGKVKEFFDVQWGDTNKTKASYVPEGYLAYSASGPDGFLDSYDYDREGVVLSAIGANCGVTYFAEGKWSCIKNTIRILPKEGLSDAAYFYYLSKTPNFWPKRGSAQPFISQTDIRELEVQLPTLESQRAIGRVLRQLDEKISVNSEMSAYLEQIAQTIFQSWFIDFDPVHAKARGEQPQGMDSATAALFPDSFEDSELGLIPAGWYMGPVSKILALQGGYSFKSTEWTNSGVPVVKIGSIRPGFVDFTKGSFVSPDLASRVPPKYELTRGSLVIGLSGYVGEVGLVEKLNVTPLLNQRVAKFGLVNSDWRIPFAYCMTRDAKFKDEVIASATGSAQANVSTSDILAIRRPIPPEHIVESFDNLIQAHFQQILGLREQNAVLRAIRDSMLPRLIAGELEIPEELLVD